MRFNEEVKEMERRQASGEFVPMPMLSPAKEKSLEEVIEENEMNRYADLLE